VKKKTFILFLNENEEKSELCEIFGKIFFDFEGELLRKSCFGIDTINQK